MLNSMKIKLLSIGIIIFFFLFQNVKSYSQTIIKNELVLSIPSINSKSYDEIKQKLSTIQGVDLLAYCDQIKSFLISYNPKEIGSGEEIARQVESLNPRYKTEIKIGTSISQIIGNCSKFQIPQPDTNISK
jgi:hypothetical protein